MKSAKVKPELHLGIGSPGFSEHLRANKGPGISAGEGFIPQLSAAITALLHSSTLTPSDKLDTALRSSQCRPPHGWQKPFPRFKGSNRRCVQRRGLFFFFFYISSCRDGEVRACVCVWLCVCRYQSIKMSNGMLSVRTFCLYLRCRTQRPNSDLSFIHSFIFERVSH